MIGPMSERSLKPSRFVCLACSYSVSECNRSISLAGFSQLLSKHDDADQSIYSCIADNSNLLLLSIEYKWSKRTDLHHLADEVLAISSQELSLSSTELNLTIRLDLLSKQLFQWALDIQINWMAMHKHCKSNATTLSEVHKYIARTLT